MPVFFQHQINDSTRLGIWKIEETDDFFKGNVPQHRDVTHPHKRLQHLAGRFLLQFLFPDFPYDLIQIADTRKPFLAGEQFHFSISHCGDYAAAIVSKDCRVGIDIEIPVERIVRIRDKYLSHYEKSEWLVDGVHPDCRTLTLLWSCKEAVFKWYGEGGVDFKKDIRLQKINAEEKRVDCFFVKTNQPLIAHYRPFNDLIIVWIINH
ncbi:MAG: 4'-phosphopantetheinyl transferase family protein [Chitinophagaceae bacterium]